MDCLQSDIIDFCKSNHVDIKCHSVVYHIGNSCTELLNSLSKCLKFSCKVEFYNVFKFLNLYINEFDKFVYRCEYFSCVGKSAVYPRSSNVIL